MIVKVQNERIPYHDIPFFLVLIPVINALNYYLTYSYIPFTSYTLITFLIDTFEGYAAWWVFRRVIIYLDSQVPYEHGPSKRILIQLFSSSLAALTVIITLTELANLVAKHTPVPASFYRYDIFIFLIWFLVLNGVYIALYYYHAMRRIEHLRREEKRVRTEGFAVKDGRHNLVVPFEDIAGFLVDDDYTALVTTDEKRYLLDRSLDNIEPSLPAEFFFRLNRQYIVHRSRVKGFTKIDNGKLTVFLLREVYMPPEAQVSRLKAAAFKSWFEAV